MEHSLHRLYGVYAPGCDICDGLLVLQLQLLQ